VLPGIFGGIFSLPLQTVAAPEDPKAAIFGSDTALVVLTWNFFDLLLGGFHHKSRRIPMKITGRRRDDSPAE
jgi:hypothetical protein